MTAFRPITKNLILDWLLWVIIPHHINRLFILPSVFYKRRAVVILCTDEAEPTPPALLPTDLTTTPYR